MADVFMAAKGEEKKACVLWFVSPAETSSVASALGVSLGKAPGMSVYKRLCEDQGEVLRSNGVPVFVCFDSKEQQPEMMSWFGPKYQYHVTSGSSFAGHVEEAMYFAFSKGYHFVTCVFELMPQLDKSYLSDSLRFLEEYDTVLLSSSQGHIGMFAVYRPSFKLSMLSNVDFDSEFSHMQIWENIRREGLSVEVLPDLLAVRNHFDYEALSLLPKPALQENESSSEKKVDSVESNEVNVSQVKKELEVQKMENSVHLDSKIQEELRHEADEEAQMEEE